jgi:hypothetical protein
LNQKEVKSCAVESGGRGGEGEVGGGEGGGGEGLGGGGDGGVGGEGLGEGNGKGTWGDGGGGAGTFATLSACTRSTTEGNGAVFVDPLCDAGQLCKRHLHSWMHGMKRQVL